MITPKIGIAISGLALLLAGLLWITYPLSTNVVCYAWWRAFPESPVSEGYVQSGDAKIHYQTFGDGPPVVLLHGGMSSSLDWFAVVPQLSRQFRTILIDLRGHGRSEMGKARFTYRLLAQDVRNVLDQLAIERSDVVGWSDGGNVALLFALDYPNRIQRLITISANFNPSGLTEEAVALTDLPGGGQSTVGRLLYELRSATPARWKRLTSKVSRMWKNYPTLQENDLAAIRAPTLVVIGSDDYIRESHAKTMVEAIPGSKLLILPNTGHAILRTSPQVLLENIGRFLSPSQAKVQAKPG
jgi:pimeloyl-ACP methyl ester carboxylesterase